MPRRLGQHFLFDPSILDRIVDALEPASDDVVIEIGAGKGTLTRRLAPRVGWVIAVEKDARLAMELGAGRGEQARVPDNVTVVEGDALELRWWDLIQEVPLPAPRSQLPFKLVGNLPYSITTPLIAKTLEPPEPRLAVFLVQREVADRLVAPPGNKTYGALSVGVQSVAVVERLFSVPAGAFRPPPRVESGVVRLRLRPSPLVELAERVPFRRFVVGMFSRRRKQLRRVLRAQTGRSAEAVDLVLNDLGLDPTARPEVLEPQMFVRLFRAFGR